MHCGGSNVAWLCPYITKSWTRNKGTYLSQMLATHVILRKLSVLSGTQPGLDQWPLRLTSPNEFIFLKYEFDECLDSRHLNVTKAPFLWWWWARYESEYIQSSIVRHILRNGYGMVDTQVRKPFLLRVGELTRELQDIAFELSLAWWFRKKSPTGEQGFST